MASVARITGTGTVTINGGAVVGTDGLVAGRNTRIHAVVVTGTGGAGTAIVHATTSGTGTGTVIVAVTAGTLSNHYDFGPGGDLVGIRVVPAGTTGGLQTIVVFD